MMPGLVMASSVATATRGDNEAISAKDGSGPPWATRDPFTALADAPAATTVPEGTGNAPLESGVRTSRFMVLGTWGRLESAWPFLLLPAVLMMNEDVEPRDWRISDARSCCCEASTIGTTKIVVTKATVLKATGW